MDKKKLRLQVFLAKAGLGSRRHCESLIEEGRVAVNGETVQQQGITVNPDSDTITLDGKKVRIEKNKIYIALHKPPGYMCSHRDDKGRPLIYQLVSPIIKERLFTVGRLDFLSSGLILLTNDGDFADKIMHPSGCIEKEYLVETKKPVEKTFLDKYKKGIYIKGIKYTLKRYKWYGPNKFALILEEGKNREIRNILHAWNIPVARLHRIRIGPVQLATLRPGEFRKLTEREIKGLINADNSGN
ncbi:pseudouridine synthase [Spirochaetia bacterium 38H-sp]|uniref:Pseudouridine synthase n=1 Tax=Rarispira pelagica TaxID=3141764 RepID=A0ABU9UB43_9SPIR